MSTALKEGDYPDYVTVDDDDDAYYGERRISQQLRITKMRYRGTRADRQSQRLETGRCREIKEGPWCTRVCAVGAFAGRLASLKANAFNDSCRVSYYQKV